MKFKLVDKKTLTEDKNPKAVLVTVSPKIFLQLTTPEDGADIAMRAKRIGAYDEEKAGILDLNIGGDGRVKSHEGRARSTAAGSRMVKVRMELDNNAKSWKDFPEVFTGQFDPSIKIPKTEFHLIQDAQATTDVSDVLKNATYMIAHKDLRTGEHRLGSLTSKLKNIMSVYAGSGPMSIDGNSKILYVSFDGEEFRPVNAEEKAQLQAAGVKIK